MCARTAVAVVAAAVGVVLVAGPVQAGQPAREPDPAIAGLAASGDPCAIPPGGEAPLMCQSGVVVPDEAEPAPARPVEDRDRTVLLGALGAGAVVTGAGAVLVMRRRRASAVVR